MEYRDCGPNHSLLNSWSRGERKRLQNRERVERSACRASGEKSTGCTVKRPRYNLKQSDRRRKPQTTQAIIWISNDGITIDVGLHEHTRLCTQFIFASSPTTYSSPSPHPHPDPQHHHPPTTATCRHAIRGASLQRGTRHPRASISEPLS